MCNPISHGMVDFQSHVSKSKSKLVPDQWRKQRYGSIKCWYWIVQFNITWYCIHHDKGNTHRSWIELTNLINNTNHVLCDFFLDCKILKVQCTEWQHTCHIQTWVARHPHDNTCNCLMCMKHCGSDFMNLPLIINTGDFYASGQCYPQLVKIHCGTDMTWWHIRWSTSIQVMPCCPMIPNHYLNHGFTDIGKLVSFYAYRLKFQFNENV